MCTLSLQHWSEIGNLAKEMKRNIEVSEHAAAGVEAGKILVRLVTLPTSHHLLKNTSATSLVSVLSRNLYTGALSFTLSTFAVLASIATSIERMATEIRGLQNLNNVK